jgi:transcriptional regulator with PAS, ATPase and Fis domain
VREHLPCIVGESHVLQDVIAIVSRAAPSPDAAALITGESGTGKELLARTVHFKSPNHKGPFVSLNCAALPAELIESELFGYAPGAFSGARASGKIGLIQEAEGGTLFLDEMGDLSLEGQAKLLRFLESGEYYQVGDTRLRRARVRLVAATNQDPETLMAERRLRPDLFYRLAVIRIQTPSLRQRPEDVLPIARFFLEDFARKYGKTFTGIAPTAAARLEAHPWPGNIRELRNAVERGVLLGPGPLLEEADLALGSAAPTPEADTPAPASWPARGFPPLPPEGLDLAALDAHFLREAQQRSGGNDRAAARLLHMSYYAFRYRKQRLDAGG